MNTKRIAKHRRSIGWTIAVGLALTALLGGCKREIPPPTIMLLTPAEGEMLREDGELTFTVQAVEGVLEAVEVMVNDDPVQFPALELKTFGRFRVPLPVRELGPGEHRISVTARAVDDELRSSAAVGRGFHVELPPTTLTGVELIPERVEQGRFFSVDLTFDGPVAEASGAVFERAFPFYLVEEGLGEGGWGERWRALAACRLYAEPGGNTLTVEYSDPFGNGGSESYTLEVTRGDFESYYIQLSPDVESKLDPAIIERESAYTKEVVSRYSPEQLWEPGGFVRPVPGRITSPFGQQRTYSTGGSSSHIGVDLKAADGDPVVATARGRVVIAQEMIVRGGFVCIDHGRGLFSLYNHLSRLDVAEGQVVEAGERIGLAGSTGVVTGPHLHFEVRLTTWAVDPLALIENPPVFE